MSKPAARELGAEQAAAAAEIDHGPLGDPAPAQLAEQVPGGRARETAEAGVVDVREVVPVARAHAAPPPAATAAASAAANSSTSASVVSKEHIQRTSRASSSQT